MNLKPELSMKNKYWISKHRYYELKHFCMQYPEWKNELKTINLYNRPSSIVVQTSISDSSVEKIAEKKLKISSKIELVERLTRDADSELSDYILIGVTLGKPYDYLRTVKNIPCCKDVYYDMYRRFFWLLDRAKD